MVYVVAFFGFICGFVVGQYILKGLLKDRSREEILNNKSLHWIYGTMNWIIAFFIAYVAVSLYQGRIPGLN